MLHRSAGDAVAYDVQRDVRRVQCVHAECGVAFGSPVSDRATLSGLATEPGSAGSSTTYPTINPTTLGAYAGSIQFTLRGPADTGCGGTATGTGTNPQTVPVDTAVGNKVYGPVFFTPARLANITGRPPSATPRR